MFLVLLSSPWQQDNTKALTAHEMGKFCKCVIFFSCNLEKYTKTLHFIRAFVHKGVCYPCSHTVCHCNPR